ncbi:MAG: hypothetical protein HYU51_00365 [Candidatus Rokubacteria bacterium]|nr:hypothetical protein [Candidatus Rokubacteria bacterium]
MEIFEDDDEGYLRWLRLHPNGYVLNYKRPPEVNVLKLHHSTCGDITGTPHRGDLWTVAYGKACSDDRRGLERYARQLGGSALECGNCFR